MSGRTLTRDELQLLEFALNSVEKPVNIRLREGEYQFELTKAIASFELELCFPDVRDLIRKLYGESKAEEIQFVRKIQTILKKMEKSGIVKILPKKQPWGLQRYALSSFRFQDVEKNPIVFATEAEADRSLDLIRSSPTIENIQKLRPSHRKVKISSLMVVLIVSYAAILWTLTQPITDLSIFVMAFSIAFSAAAICSLLLGILVTRK